VRICLNDFSLFGDLDNLCVNSKVSDRFKPFIPGMDDLFLEVLGADCTQRTGQQLSSDEMNFPFLSSSMLTKPESDVNQDTLLSSWLFTLALFVATSEKTQTLGDTLVSSQISIHQATKGMSAQEKMDLYHCCLIEILKMW
jgi:hypothetical protein